MSVLTIVEAAKQFNVTRPRIYRSIKRGELTTTLSDDGVQLVQVQDMIRLFGNSQVKLILNDVQVILPKKIKMKIENRITFI